MIAKESESKSRKNDNVPKVPSLFNKLGVLNEESDCCAVNWWKSILYFPKRVESFGLPHLTFSLAGGAAAPRALY